MSIRMGRALAGGLMLALALAGVWTAWRKGIEHRPEWSFWHRAATSTDPLVGLEGMSQGYLPGISALLKILFVLPERVALALLIAINLASAVVLFLIFCRMMASATPGRALWLAAPFYLALQNNQLVLPMLAAAMLGFEALRRHRRGQGAIFMALALLIKALALPILALMVLRRRYIVTAVGAGLLAVTLSLLGTAWVYGWEASFRLHVAWPIGVLGENPTEVLESGADGVDSFAGNESYQAWIVRAEPWLGETLVSWLNPALLVLSLLCTAALIARRFHASELRPDEIALWLAWVAFATPFGRYYYLVLLVPAWLRLSSVAYGQGPRVATGALVWLARALPVLTWGSRSSGWYAVITGVTFAWLLVVLWTETSRRGGGAWRMMGPFRGEVRQ